MEGGGARDIRDNNRRRAIRYYTTGYAQGLINTFFAAHAIKL
jgi:hypothetical protein